MKKTIKFTSVLLLLFGVFVLIFSLSSKVPDFTNYTACEDRINQDAFFGKIRISFDVSQQITFRNPNYRTYVPSPDLRWHNPNFLGSSVQTDLDNYYCTVVVTSPQCANWEWNGIFEASNYANSSGEMRVKLPPTGYDARIKVTYFERRDQTSTEPDFNIPMQYSTGSSRLIYGYDRVFMGWGSAGTPQPTYVIVTSHIPAN